MDPARGKILDVGTFGLNQSHLPAHDAGPFDPRGRLRLGTKKVTLTPHQLERLRRWGAPATALGWLPLAGDALCLAAGWLQLNAAAVLLWQVLGRFGRYWVVAQTSVM